MAFALTFFPQMEIQSLTSGYRYRLRRMLGSGAFGQVWLCAETLSGQMRAVKILLGEEVKPSVQLEVDRLQQALNAAGHEFVPNLYEASLGRLPGGGGALPDVFMIVMEFIDGVNAFTLCKTVSVPEVNARIILRNTTRALSQLHKVGMVHRDVKGANVMISRTGRCYLCDFGVSTILTDEFELCKKQGTPAYMAPEICALGVRKEAYDEKVDIWALGVFAMELALGSIPWEGLSAHRRMLNISTRDIPNELLASGFSSVYQEFVTACLHRDPKCRPSAEELLSFSCLESSKADKRAFDDWAEAGFEN